MDGFLLSLWAFPADQQVASMGSLFRLEGLDIDENPMV